MTESGFRYGIHLCLFLSPSAAPNRQASRENLPQIAWQKAGLVTVPLRLTDKTDSSPTWCGILI